MKTFIVSFIVLFSITSFSQTKHEDGLYKEYYKNGNLKVEGVYNDNHKVGRWKDYYENGQLKKEDVFLFNGNWSGFKRLYSLKGNLSSETKLLENGIIEERHYFEKGNIKREFYLKATSEGKRFLKTGLYKEFYDNGAVKIESNYRENNLVGIWKQFYSTAELEWEVAYINDYKQGVYKQFYKNGKIKVEGLHDLDLKNGEEKIFDSIGNQIHKLKYKKGVFKNVSKIKNLKVVDVPDGIVERVPVYPGCENLVGNFAKKKCMSKAISHFVVSKFNTAFVSDTGLKGLQKIYVLFKIDKSGAVVDLRARAKHKALEAEGVRVLALLPKMTPGFQYGKPVKVPYSLPIVLKI